jgi:hypothetical protein
VRDELTTGDVERTEARATLADLGWHPLARLLAAVQVGVLLASLMLYRAVGLTVHWASDWLFVVLVGIVLLLWLTGIKTPGRSRRDWRLADSSAAVVFFLTLFQISAPLQYGAIALGRPFVDATLAAVDRSLGIDVPALVNWTAGHVRLTWVLQSAYATFVPQLVLAYVALAIVGHRKQLWELLFHLHVCILGAVLCLAIWPAQCVFTFLHFQALEPEVFIGPVVSQIADLHAGHFTQLSLDQMAGLISFPSFHASGACAVTWALRRMPIWVWLPVLLVNVTLIAATVLLGLHYAADLAGAAVLLAMSALLYRLIPHPV